MLDSRREKYIRSITKTQVDNLQYHNACMPALLLSPCSLELFQVKWLQPSRKAGRSVSHHVLCVWLLFMCLWELHYDCDILIYVSCPLSKSLWFVLAKQKLKGEWTEKGREPKPFPPPAIAHHHPCRQLPIWQVAWHVVGITRAGDREAGEARVGEGLLGWGAGYIHLQLAVPYSTGGALCRQTAAGAQTGPVCSGNTAQVITGSVVEFPLCFNNSKWLSVRWALPIDDLGGWWVRVGSGGNSDRGWCFVRVVAKRKDLLLSEKAFLLLESVNVWHLTRS